MTARPFRTKIVDIKAIQWDGTDITFFALKAWAGELIIRSSDGSDLIIFEPTGSAYVKIGDWIIKQNDVFSLCPKDIFAWKYEAVS